MATANKHGLRKAAAERTNRHAQRTPLPPRPGVVEAAKETPAEEFNRLTALPLSKQTKAIQARIRKLSDLPENTGVREEPKRPAKVAKVAKVPTQRQAPEKAAQSRPVNQGGSTKSEIKAAAFAEEAIKHGWREEMVSHDDSREEVELTVSRGNETIYLRWLGGVFQHPATYTIADRTVQIRNAMHAKRDYLPRSPEAAEAELSRVVSNKAFKKKAPAERKPVRLPFDPSLATDEEVITNLLGQAVAWNNRISNGTESAIVGRDVKKVRITVSSSGERIFNFCCSATGYRSFRVTDLMKVGRARSITTKGQSNSGAPMAVEVE